MTTTVCKVVFHQGSERVEHEGTPAPTMLHAYITATGSAPPGMLLGPTNDESCRALITAWQSGIRAGVGANGGQWFAKHGHAQMSENMGGKLMLEVGWLRIHFEERS